MKRALSLIAILFATRAADAISLDTVPIGNPSNLPSSNFSYGEVGYEYRIGKYEVTNSQYVEFLNGVDPYGSNLIGLYDPQMSFDIHGGITLDSGASEGEKYEVKSGRGNNPVVFVSWFDAIRFANWLHNGQRAGDTESGAYELGPLGSNGIPLSTYGIARDAEAKWWLPNVNEWHKAAYHKNNGTSGDYWNYPTSTDREPRSLPPSGLGGRQVANAANFVDSHGRHALTDRYYDESFNHLTDVGAYYLSPSPYGTFDQAGNVWELTESAKRYGGSSRSFLRNLAATYRGSGPNPAYADNHTGFRVATIPVPEPPQFHLIVMALIASLNRRVLIAQRDTIFM
jgi:formylglycine-generating enzyme required for sulfatase activity